MPLRHASYIARNLPCENRGSLVRSECRGWVQQAKFVGEKKLSSGGEVREEGEETCLKAANNEREERRRKEIPWREAESSPLSVDTS